MTKRTCWVLLTLWALMLWAPAPAAASGGGTIFTGLESFLQTIVDALTGNIAKLVTVLAIVAGGLMWMLSDSGSGMRRIAGAVIGAAVVISAVNIAELMGFTGALL